MPVVVTALQRGMQGLLQYLQNRRTNHRLDDAFASIDAVNTWLARALTAILQTLAQVQGAWKYVQPKARDAGDSLDTIARDVDVSFKWFIATLIPHSMSWLIGYMEQHYIVPLSQRVGIVEKQVRKLVAFQARITDWRNNIVDPTIRDWRRFKSYFDGWPTNVLNVWHDWFAHPAKFGAWATPTIAAPFVKLISEPAQRHLRDQLTQAVVEATPDVYKDVIAAAEKMLDAKVA